MTSVRTSTETRLEQRKARSVTARKWARVSTLCLFASCLSAVYQERQISPVLHDQLHVAADATVAFIYDSEGNSAGFAGFSSFGGGAGESQYGPITTALLKLRQ